jgi:heme-degrading monooxygenase HmoA
MSVLEIAHLTSPAGKGDDLERQLKSAVEQLVADPETKKVEVFRGVEKPDEFTLMITWSSIEAHQKWRTTDRRAKYREIVDPALGAPITAEHHTLVVKHKG